MPNQKKTILTNLLKALIDGKSVTSIDTRASNTNQYFKTIKDEGIELLEEWEPNPHNTGRHKKRRLNPTHENIEKTKKYYLKLLRK